MIRVAVIDDDALIRESLKILLEGKEEIRIVGQGENGFDALRWAAQCDVMLLDLRMPVKSGLEVLSEVAGQTRVLVLTTFDDDAEIVRALRDGAHGTWKSAKPQDIVKAIVQLYQEKACLMPWPWRPSGAACSRRDRKNWPICQSGKARWWLPSPRDFPIARSPIPFLFRKEP